MTNQTESNDLPLDRPIEVLNFEDYPEDALLVSRVLRKVFLMQFNVTAAPTLAAGIELLRDRHFDVALLDLDLPDSQGISTFERVRNEAPELPLIVLTGNNDDRL